ncbi:MAG: hypothetical protein II649_08640 [Kiritimatiellae bacterium]|nr:hypothetical protein [Kiritimatiellia bacterium]
MTKKTIAGAAAMVAVAGTMVGCCPNCGKQEVKMYTNKDFYVGGTFDENGINKGGKFDVEKAKQAYFDMMRRFNYPVFPSFLDDKLTNPKEGTQYLGFWATDFVKGDFMKFGMGGVIWVDEIKEEYFGHDIYLLPGQALAEHSHVPGKPVDPGVATDRWTGEKFIGKNIPAKMESWLVRNGWVYGFSDVGEPNLDKFPEAKKLLSAYLYDQKADKPVNLKSLHVEKWTADGVAHKLPRTGGWHFMMGGTEGAIVSEFANFHDSKCNRFSVPGVGF